MLMTVLTAITIVLSIRIVGIVLLISLLTVPTVIAMSLTKSYPKIITLASLLAVVGNVIGIWVAYEVDFPVGATTIILLGITLFIVKLLTLPSRKSVHKKLKIGK
jgi:zinc transport system permease protein